MGQKIIFSAFLTFLFGAVSYGQIGTGSPNRLLFSQIPNSDGGAVVNVSYTGLERPNLQVFESLVPATSAAECQSSTAFPNPRVLGPDVASLVFDPTTSTYKLRWVTPKNRKDTCRVLRVGDSAVDTADLAIWQSQYGSSAFAETNDARPAALSQVTYTYEVRNPSSATTGGKE